MHIFIQCLNNKTQYCMFYHSMVYKYSYHTCFAGIKGIPYFVPNSRLSPETSIQSP